VEVIIFVVIVSIAVVSVVSALSLAVRQSGDPLVSGRRWRSPSR